MCGLSVAKYTFYSGCVPSPEDQFNLGTTQKLTLHQQTGPGEWILADTHVEAEPRVYGIHGTRQGPPLPMEGNAIWVTHRSRDVPTRPGPGDGTRNGAACFRLPGRHYSHWNIVSIICLRLRVANLLLNRKKCQRKLVYLGHVVSEKWIHTDPYGNYSPRRTRRSYAVT